jgi:hypothetical protein
MMSKDVYEVLIGACSGGISISMLCEKSEVAPHEDTLLYHLREKIALELVERVDDTLLQKNVLNVLLGVEFVTNNYSQPSSGDEDNSDGLNYSKPNVEPPHFAPILYARAMNNG